MQCHINIGKYLMKAEVEEIKNAIKSKIAFWHNIKSKKLKAGLIILSLGLIGLKIFTTVLTFEWFKNLLA